MDSGLPGIGSSDTVHAAAAYDGMLFVKARVSGNAEKLFAYEYEIGSSALTVTSKGAASSSDFEINSKVLDCTGLFADESGVYCLLAAKNDRQNSEPLYAVGKLIRYSHDMSDKDEFGLNPSSGTPFQSPVSHGNSLTFDARYFSYPALFIGYDEDYLYIADDGVGIANGKEGWRVTGEKNRIAAFNRKTNILTFTDTAATWFAYYNEYPSKKTAVLQWEKKEPTNSLSPMRYWTSADGKSVFSETNKLWDPSAAEKPTDIFCYDQDGNLYILWSDTGYTYYVRRFIAGVDGYVKDGDATLGTLSDISAIAVDISDGKKTLYYSYKTSPTSRFVKSLVWDTDFYSAAFPTTVYEIQTGSTEITALAANRDGVFVGLKEEFVDSTIDKYRLKVKKYNKIGNPALPDGEITLFDNAVSYTNLENVPIPKPIGTAAGHEYQEAINGLQVFDGVLYGISSKLHQVWQEQAPSYYVVDIVKNGSILYKIGNTAGTFSDSVEQIAEKASNDASKTGYGFYRFIAVKYDEAERIRLIIASDGAWGTGGANPPPHNPNDLKNTDKVLEYDLAGHLQGEKNSGGSFSKTLKLGSGFEW